MSRFVALLRAVNVGGVQLPMAELRRVMSDLGFRRVDTYVQSGNVLFAADGGETPERAQAHAQAIELRIERDLGPRVGALVLTADELARVVAGNPFAAEADAEEKELHVTFLFPVENDFGETDEAAAGEAFAAAFAALELPAAEGERAAFGGAPVPRPVVYLCLPNGYGRTKLNNAFFERRLGTAATTRNWRTVTALAAMAAEP